MYNINDKSSAIRNIQKYLAKIYEGTLNVNENGLFDEKTIIALNKFQEENGLYVKASVDFSTFSAISDAYNKAIIAREMQKKNPHIKFPITRGMQGLEIYKLNSMLGDILRHYSLFDYPPLVNYYSEETEKAVNEIRKIFNLSKQNGIDEVLYSRLEDEIKSINIIINSVNE